MSFPQEEKTIPNDLASNAPPNPIKPTLIQRLASNVTDNLIRYMDKCPSPFTVVTWFSPFRSPMSVCLKELLGLCKVLFLGLSVPIMWLLILYISIIYGQTAYAHISTKVTSAVCGLPLMTRLVPLCYEKPTESTTSVMTASGSVMSDIGTFYKVRREIAYQAVLHENPALILVAYMSNVSDGFKELDTEMVLANRSLRASTAHATLTNVSVSAREVGLNLYGYSRRNSNMVTRSITTSEFMLEALQEAYRNPIEWLIILLGFVPPRIRPSLELYQDIIAEMERTIDELVERGNTLLTGLALLESQMGQVIELASENVEIDTVLKNPTIWTRWFGVDIGEGRDVVLDMSDLFQTIQNRTREGRLLVTKTSDFLQQQRQELQVLKAGSELRHQSAHGEPRRLKEGTILTRKQLLDYDSVGANFLKGNAEQIQRV